MVPADISIDVTTNATTADLVYFDTESEALVLRDWNAALTLAEGQKFVLVGAVRAPDDNNPSSGTHLSLLFDYTIDGVDPRDVSGETLRLVMPQTGIVPNLDTTAGTFTIYSDTVILWRGSSYAISTNQVLDLSGSASTADKIYFNVSDGSFSVKSFSASLTQAERRSLVLLAAIRSPDVNNPDAEPGVSIPCPYSIDGASASAFGGAYISDYDEFVRGVAHRGFSGAAPENTLPAFALAKRNGFAFVEADLRLTSDDEWVLLHDADIDRTSDGSGNIDALTLAQARSSDYSNGKTGYSSTAIPTAAEFFALCKRLSLVAFVELKIDPDQARVDDLIALAEAAGMSENIWYNAFSLSTIDKVSVADPSAKIGYDVTDVTSTVITEITNRKTSVNEVFIVPQFSSLTTAKAGLALAADVEMYCWTVNDAADAVAAANLGRSRHHDGQSKHQAGASERGWCDFAG